MRNKLVLGKTMPLLRSDRSVRRQSFSGVEADQAGDNFSQRKKRKPRPSVSASGALAGRFSGRLLRKEDEAILNQECFLLGPLLGGTQHPDGDPEKERSQLSQIVRAIANGDIRRFLEARVAKSQWLADHFEQSKAKLAVYDKELADNRLQLQSLREQLEDLKGSGHMPSRPGTGSQPTASTHANTPVDPTNSEDLREPLAEGAVGRMDSFTSGSLDRNHSRNSSFTSRGALHKHGEDSCLPAISSATPQESHNPFGQLQKSMQPVGPAPAEHPAALVQMGSNRPWYDGSMHAMDSLTEEEECLHEMQSLSMPMQQGCQLAATSSTHALQQQHVQSSCGSFGVKQCSVGSASRRTLEGDTASVQSCCRIPVPTQLPTGNSGIDFQQPIAKHEEAALFQRSQAHEHEDVMTPLPPLDPVWARLSQEHTHQQHCSSAPTQQLEGCNAMMLQSQASLDEAKHAMMAACSHHVDQFQQSLLTRSQPRFQGGGGMKLTANSPEYAAVFPGCLASDPGPHLTAKPWPSDATTQFDRLASDTWAEGYQQNRTELNYSPFTSPGQSLQHVLCGAEPQMTPFGQFRISSPPEQKPYCEAAHFGRPPGARPCVQERHAMPPFSNLEENFDPMLHEERNQVDVRFSGPFSAAPSELISNPHGNRSSTR